MNLPGNEAGSPSVGWRAATPATTASPAATSASPAATSASPATAISAITVGSDPNQALPSGPTTVAMVPAENVPAPRVAASRAPGGRIPVGLAGPAGFGRSGNGSSAGAPAELRAANRAPIAAPDRDALNGTAVAPQSDSVTGRSPTSGGRYASPSSLPEALRPFAPGAPNIQMDVAAMVGSPHWKPGDDDVMPSDGRHGSRRPRLRDHLPW